MIQIEVKKYMHRDVFPSSPHWSLWGLCKGSIGEHHRSADSSDRGVVLAHAWHWHVPGKKKQSTMKPHKRYHKQTNIKISNIGETWNLGTATTDRTNHPKKSITCPEYSSFNDIMNLNPFFPVSWHWISPRLGYTLEAAAGRFMLGLLALLRLLVFPLSFSCFGIFFDFAGTNSSFGIFFDFAGPNLSLLLFRGTAFGFGSGCITGADWLAAGRLRCTTRFIPGIAIGDGQKVVAAVDPGKSIDGSSDGKGKWLIAAKNWK